MSGKEEMGLNATRWAEVAKRELPKDTGFIFLFFPKNAVGQGAGVCASNINQRALIDEIKAVLRKFNEVPRIVVPGGD